MTSTRDDQAARNEKICRKADLGIPRTCSRNQNPLHHERGLKGGVHLNAYTDGSYDDGDCYGEPLDKVLK